MLLRRFIWHLFYLKATDYSCILLKNLRLYPRSSPMFYSFSGSYQPASFCSFADFLHSNSDHPLPTMASTLRSYPSEVTCFPLRVLLQIARSIEQFDIKAGMCEVGLPGKGGIIAGEAITGVTV